MARRRWRAWRPALSARGAFAAAWLALLLAGSACAQNGVTLFGAVDLAIANYRGDGGGSKTHLVSGGNQNNHLGLRGREDLGGGLYAGFELDAGFAPDTGTGLPTSSNNQGATAAASQSLTFNRRSFVSVGGRWGELRLGRDYVPSFWPLYLYDPFRTGVGFGGITVLGSTVTNLRASNSIGYFTPNCDAFGCKGVFAQAMYAFGENPSGSADSRDGNVAGLRLGYAAGALEVSVGSTRTTNETVGHFTQTTGGGAYDAGWGRLMFLAGENRTGRPVAALNGGTRAPFWQVGAWLRLGPGTVPIAYTRVSRNDPQDSSASKIAVGYVYDLSRRTALYTTYARIDNRNGLALPVNVGADSGPAPLPGRPASGWEVGLRHSF